MKLEIDKSLLPLGHSHGYLVGSGTTALYVGLKALKLPAKSKVVVPNICCPDVAYAVIWAGLTPIFADVERETLNISPSSLELLLREQKNVSCVIAVHLFGQPCKIDEIKKIAERHHVRLVEDCAQALGNKVGNKFLGSFGDFSIFSFGKGKILELGHGGVVATSDTMLASHLEQEMSLLSEFDAEYGAKMAKRHRKIYYFLFDLARKWSRFNILYLVFPLFFKDYYLYKFDDSFEPAFRTGMRDLTENRALRISRQNQYDEKLKDVHCLANVALLREADTALSRYCLLVEDAETTAKKLRDSAVHSNTMYPMLVDRFYLFFNKKNYPNSIFLKNKILNLWTDASADKNLDLTAKILKSDLGKK